MSSPLSIYFAWCDEADAFDIATHAVFDERILAGKIAQDEGDFATLEIDVLNPFEGLLAAGRQQWCWLSTDDGTIIPLFHGRLVGVPEQITGEQMRMQFIARPSDYEAVKIALADTLKALPYYDRVWISGDLADTDAVLNTYGARYHIDRTTLDVTISDELEGEDGTLSVTQADSHYDELNISYSDKPKLKAKFSGTLTWTQSGAGTIDLTGAVYDLFRSKYSIYIVPRFTGIISTLTGDGLVSAWPTGGTTFGGGWTVNQDTAIVDASSIYRRYTYDVTYQDLSPNWSTVDTSLSAAFFDALVDYEVKFPISALRETAKFDWVAARDRTEILEFTMYPDLQSLESDTSDTESTVTLTISADDTVTEITGSPGTLPIDDKRRISYLNTVRGQYSVEYALLLCRAALRRGARAVEIKARIPWTLGITTTLRKNATITDYRIPGGVATGKIISYEINASARDGFYADITIGCAIGHGGTVTVVSGTPVYADDGYVDPGYQKSIGADVLVLTNDLAYETLDDFTVDDDGVNLFNLNERNAVTSLTLTGGVDEQIAAVDAALDPIEALKAFPSRVCMQLVKVADVSFKTTYTPTIETLPVPLGIDLEAAATP